MYLPLSEIKLSSKLKVMAELDDVEYVTQIAKVKDLPTKWYKSTFVDVYDSFVQHYNKHVLGELPKAGKPIVSMEKYFDDATNFYRNYDGMGTVRYDTLEDGTSGMRIRSNAGPGGWFTGPDHPLGPGIPTSFWYY